MVLKGVALASSTYSRNWQKMQIFICYSKHSGHLVYTGTLFSSSPAIQIYNMKPTWMTVSEVILTPSLLHTYKT